ncbi:conserved hypothetical protein [Talaromyces stipitatus ATCC 10500]|uniref:Homeobox and C2H2 transcription factor n=1 Tax=Talaromyces stipitatus (strain ATCC 10500 / CBS 375.48 / QM 6759 / NRRL 1006) TaxID=441959 RepID=B8MLR1_TALSN|nr:uncharacterized protein TSTA_098880 [Talaromyces stipitatus ATCC 10500]EED13633.1 conserved hypothetical protein [Talaromyces stipitatus ATCC 10500]
MFSCLLCSGVGTGDRRPNKELSDLNSSAHASRFRGRFYKMEQNDPFIFGPEASIDMETLYATHYSDAYRSNNPHEMSSSSYLDIPETRLSDDAVTDWSNLQFSLNGISSPSSQSSAAQDASIFYETFLSPHQDQQVSNLTMAIEGIIHTEAGTVFDATPVPDELPIHPSYVEQKPAARMTKQSLRALKDWKIEHGDAAKPTKHQLHRLQRRANLSAEQIMNWFNHTKRRTENLIAGHSQPQLETLGPLQQEVSSNNAIQRPLTPAVRDIIHTSTTPLGDMDPMKRWENSPPEHEAALFSDIAKALAHSPLPSAKVRAQLQAKSPHSASRADSTSTRSSINDIHRNLSASSLDSDIPGSIAWSDHSATSAQSNRSGSGLEYRRRRARKRRTNPLSRGVNSLQNHNVPKIFQCTFCTDSFKTKYDWSRHEKSLHLALESWTCSPFGSVIRDDTTQETQCVYCNKPSPTEDHISTHRYLACDGRPESERTYYRKDHLRQHLRLVHSCRFVPSMEKWKHTPEFVRSRCGFCDEILTTWQVRIDHLAGHFRAGSSMAEWSGGWGFEPHISRLVENGIPPFLIHQERNTVAPFSGSISLLKKHRINNATVMQMDENKPRRYINQYSYPANGEMSWYDSFETQLATYINTTIETEGRIPSDKEIQDQGRRFVYDEDDPWHQTIAENAMWLEYFKERHGFVRGDT